MTDEDNADDQALYANTPAQAKYLLHGLKEGRSRRHWSQCEHKLNKIPMF